MTVKHINQNGLNKWKRFCLKACLKAKVIDLTQFEIHCTHSHATFLDLRQFTSTRQTGPQTETTVLVIREQQTEKKIQIVSCDRKSEISNIILHQTNELEK